MPLEPKPDAVDSKLLALRQYLRELGSVLVCYSGGIDSALVLAVATSELGDNAIALTAVSPSLPDSEREGALLTAQTLRARHHLVISNELKRPGYVQNGPDRCFHCKSELYEIAHHKQSEWQLQHIVNGTNLDDLRDHRPGLQAAHHAQVKSPLAELGFNKSDVREAAQRLGLQIWDKPAAACLSSRIPYGTAVTPKRLKQIGDYEADLHALGFRQLRVRYHGELARIELALDELQRGLEAPMQTQITALGHRHGFETVTIDPRGYRQGSHNEVLKKNTALRKKALPLV